MKYHVLGPLQVHGGDGVALRPGPREHRILAVLLLAPGQIVTRQHLIDAVWDDPPATATRQLQNCVSALRRCLPIAAEGPGYRLRLQPDQLDAQVFADAVRAAQELIALGRRAEAADRLRAGLALWRGPAFAGITGRVIQAGAARLDEQHLAATELCLDLELELGRHYELAGELAELVSSYPLRERLVGQLMMALHRSGRQADALREYQSLRHRLADELGLDPSPQLRHLHTAILRDETVSADGRDPHSIVAPRQLPAAVAHFVGRQAELSELADLAASTTTGGTVVISAIDGSAGIGKTALAVHWAHRAAEHFPDGQLYVNLRGFDPSGQPVTPAEAIRGFLDAFAVPAAQIPVNPDAQTALYRSLLAGRRVLIVLDNARDVDQVRPMLPGGGTCLVLITSRNQLTGLIVTEGARPLTLDLLTTAEAGELLARKVGHRRVAGEPDATDKLAGYCARLPLALAIVAARAAAHPTFPLAAFAAELADDHRRLDALDGGDHASQVRAVFSWSYHGLTVAAANLFRLLGLTPGPDVTVAAAASLVAVSAIRARTLLDELARAHLVTEHLPGRFSCHDLLRAYANEQARLVDDETGRRVAATRIFDYYLHTACAAALLLHPQRDPIAVSVAQPGVTLEHLTDHAHALAWFTTAYPALLAAVRQATVTGFDSHAWRLAWTLADFCERQGHWHEWAATQQIALAAATRLGDRTGQADSRRALGRAYTNLGSYDHAHRHLRASRELSAGLDDEVNQAHAHINIAQVYERQCRPAAALNHANRALRLYRTAGHRHGQANALNAVGWFHGQLGNHAYALTCCEEAFAIHRELGDLRGQAVTSDSLGYTYHQRGDYARAAVCYQHSLDLLVGLGERFNMATVLIHLGETEYAAGDTAAARAAWQHALTILEQLRHADVDPVRLRLAALDSVVVGSSTPRPWA